MFQLLRRRWYIVVLIIVIMGGFFLQKKSATVKGSNGKKAYTVERQTLKDTLSLSGSIDANEKTVVRFASAGKVVWLGAKEGDIVKKGQTIATMDTRDINDRIQKYLNTYSKTRAQFDQTKQDNEKTALNGITPELRAAANRLIDQSQGDLNNSVLDLEIQNLAKESSYLVSPIDGILTKSPIAVAGVNISSPTQAEFEIVNPDTLFFAASADQTDVVKLHEGMRADITLDPYPDTTLTGTIQSVAFTPDENETGTAYKIKMEFDPGGLNFKMGMTGDATFTFKEKPNVIVIPENYIKTENNTSYVMKKVRGKVIKQLVEVGDKVEGDVEIISGLQEGDQIYD